MAEKPTYEELEHRVRELEKAEFEQKSAMDTGRENETLQNTLIESLPAGVIVIDPATRIIEKVNNAAVSMFGAPREYIIGHRCHSFLCPAAEGACPIVDLGQDVDNSEKEMICMDGTRRPVIKSVKRIQLQGQEKLLECCVDISFQKQIEQALSESEERFRAAFMMCPDAIAISTQEDGRWIDVNQAALDIFGYTREEVIGKSALDMNLWVNPNDRKRMVETLNRYGEVKNQEAQFRCKDDRLIIASVSLKPLTLKGVKHLLFLTEDITERKHTEEALKESEAIHKEIFDKSPMPLYIQDFSETADRIKELKGKNGVNDIKFYLQNNKDEVLHLIGTIKILQSNKAALDMYQADSGDNLLQVLTPVIKSDDMQHVIDQIVDFTEGKDWYEGEARNFDFKGNVLDIILRKAVMNREKNGLSKIIVSLTDVTALHRSHREKEKLKTQIQQTQKMESIGNLAGGIAHDFNNILYPIIGMSEMLMDDLNPASNQYENAQVIFEAGKRGSDLVKQILAFSRQAEHKLIPVRIQQVMKDVLKLSRSTIPINIEIVQDVQTECGLVMADPIQIHQIGMNLITNAYHAFGATGGKIDVRVQEITLGRNELKDSLLQPGQYALLSVSDNGCGIPLSIMNKIFDPYFTTKEKGKGTGLGLAVVYGIVKEHKGDIKVYSQVGKGTTFNVYLPLMKKDIQTNFVEKREIIETGTEKILLVDDEGPIAQLEKQMLERLGYKVTDRTSSLDALAAFKKNPSAFDLIITDMSMQNMTGEQLAKEMLSIRPDIPIIICTGFSEHVNEEIAKSMGIKGFLMKPVVKSDMAKTIRKVLDDTKIL